MFELVDQFAELTGFSDRDRLDVTLERAERAVYCAKAHGRNRVLGYAELVASGELKVSTKAGEIELF